MIFFCLCNIPGQFSVGLFGTCYNFYFKMTVGRSFFFFCWTCGCSHERWYVKNKIRKLEREAQSLVVKLSVFWKVTGIVELAQWKGVGGEFWRCSPSDEAHGTSAQVSHAKAASLEPSRLTCAAFGICFFFFLCCVLPVYCRLQQER